MKLYKLTDADGYTRRGEKNETLWGENVQHTASGTSGLCSSGVIHAYEHPLIAAFMNPIHANIKNPKLWIANGEVTHREGQLKCGCRELTTIKATRIPEISQEQRVRISIYCAIAQYKDAAFLQWAADWLSGKDRTAEAARAAAWEAAAWAAGAAAWAATWAARAAAAAEAAWAAADSWAGAEAEAAAAAWAATWAVREAARAEFNLLEILLAVVEGGK